MTMSKEEHTNRAKHLCAPMIMRPMKSYRSTLSGRVINSRAERKADMAEHNVIDARDLNRGKRNE